MIDKSTIMCYSMCMNLENNLLQVCKLPEDHEWRVVLDWGGDSDIIGGTYDCSFWRCNRCGEEDYTRPVTAQDRQDPFE